VGLKSLKSLNLTNVYPNNNNKNQNNNNNKKKKNNKVKSKPLELRSRVICQLQGPKKQIFVNIAPNNLNSIILLFDMKRDGLPILKWYGMSSCDLRPKLDGQYLA
jgi:hypothetical protein